MKLTNALQVLVVVSSLGCFDAVADCYWDLKAAIKSKQLAVVKYQIITCNPKQEVWSAWADDLYTDSVHEGTLEITRYLGSLGGKYKRGVPPLHESPTEFEVSAGGGWMFSSVRARTEIDDAVANYSLDDIKVLIAEGGIDARKLDSGGNSLLSYAASKNKGEVVQLLIDLGGKDVLNVRNVDGKTPLMHAIFMNPDPLAAETLIKAEADVNIADKNENTALSLLMWSNAPYSFRKLKALIDADAITPKLSKNKILQLVAARSDPQGVRYLSERGYEISGGILNAAWASSPATVQMLLNLGASPNEAVSNSFPLLAAFQNFHSDAQITKTIDVLIDAKADVNMANSQGQTALMEAARYCRLSAANALLKAKAKKKLKNTSGQKAYDLVKFDCGSRERQQEMLELLKP